MSIEFNLPSQEIATNVAIYTLVVILSLVGIFSRCIKKALISALFVVAIGIGMVNYSCEKWTSFPVPSYPSYPHQHVNDSQLHKAQVDGWLSATKLVSEIQEKRMATQLPEERNPSLAVAITVLCCGAAMVVVRFVVHLTM